MRWAVGLGAVGVGVVAVSLLSGCSLVGASVGSAPAAEQTADALVPGSTVRGWPAGMTPAPYLVSEAVAEFCPEPVWQLAGQSILEEIPAEVLFELEGVACAFGPPPSGDPDNALEVAYRIDEGLRPLLEAYLATAWVDDPDPEQVNCFVASISPRIWVEHRGEPYVLGPAGDWCFDTHPEWKALVDALVMTEVALDEVSFAESLD